MYISKNEGSTGIVGCAVTAVGDTAGAGGTMTVVSEVTASGAEAGVIKAEETAVVVRACGLPVGAKRCVGVWRVGMDCES